MFSIAHKVQWEIHLSLCLQTDGYKVDTDLKMVRCSQKGLLLAV